MEKLNAASSSSSSVAANPTDDSTMVWSDRYLLGHGGMDDTHREFVERVAALQTAGPAELADCLAAFEAHALEHFEQERRWMEDTSFPAAQCHVDEHTAVLNSVREVQVLLRGGASEQVARDLAHALAVWFPGHADYMDASLSQWLIKRSHGGAPVVLRRRLDPADAPVPPEVN